jgi:tetratricopeptide (TPR) repeat protein
MSFPLQLPATTLLFFALLPLGEMIGDPTRSEGGFHMPPVTLEGRWTETVLHLRGMKRIVAVGACFRVPRAAAAGALLAAVVLCGFWMAQVWKPVVADAWYNQARNLDPLLPFSAEEEQYRLGIALNPSRAAEIQKQFEQFKQQTRPDFRRNAQKSEADALYRRALALWPRHQDCRSRYSEFLLQTGRCQECVDQMQILFKRLNSTELYLRRASALRALGRNPEALRDLAAYIKRLPQFGGPSGTARL